MSKIIFFYLFADFKKWTTINLFQISGAFLVLSKFGTLN